VAHRLDRREAVVRMGAAMASIALFPRFAFARAAVRPDDIVDLAARLRAASRADALEVAAGALGAGATPATILGAAFLAGVEDIRPLPGGILHAVLMVESSFELAAKSPPREAALFALYNVDEFKASQASDRQSGDFVLDRPARRRTGGDASAARSEYVEAMSAYDPGRADRAVTALLPHVDQNEFFEILWPLAARSFGAIGHKIIYAAQVEHVLRRIGWEHAEAPLRSLSMALLVAPQPATFARARELSPRLPDGWLSGREDSAKSEALVAELRPASVSRAPEIVVEAFRAGLGPRTVWDALTLFGSELFHRRPGRRGADGGGAILPVHALTVTNAFRHAFHSTRVDGTKRLLALQSAAWLAALRDDFVRRVAFSTTGPGLEALGAAAAAAGPAKDLDALLERASPDDARVFLDAHPESAPEYALRIRERLARRVVENHQVKYAVAMEEEAARVDPRWRSRLLAPGIDYLAHPKDRDTDVHARSATALDRALVR